MPARLKRINFTCKFLKVLRFCGQVQARLEINRKRLPKCFQTLSKYIVFWMSLPGKVHNLVPRVSHLPAPGDPGNEVARFRAFAFVT